MNDNDFGHEFNKPENLVEVPICQKCGLSMVTAHLWGDAQWTANPIPCKENFVEETTPTVTVETTPTVTVEAQLDPTGIPHEIKQGLISIIIPIYNHDYSLMHYTGHCLGNVRYFTKLPHEIILVDNASPITLEPGQYPVDKVIVNKENEGYAKAVNKGIRVSQGEYICIMNNDTLVFEHWDEDMVDALNHLDLVMATPMYGEPMARAVESQQKRDVWFKKMTYDTFDTFRDFSCVMTKRKLFDELGLFDEQFFMYGEDLDFLRRMDKAEKKYASAKRVNIFHIIGATSTSLSETPEVMNKSRALLKEKWGE